MNTMDITLICSISSIFLGALITGGLFGLGVGLMIVGAISLMLSPIYLDLRESHLKKIKNKYDIY